MYLALATLILTTFLATRCVDGQAKTCYFGPLPQPDPDNPDSEQWITQAMEEIRENCPGTRRNARTVAPPRDCLDALARSASASGVYTVQPRDAGKPIEVYCDMETDGWTVFQRRQDGSVDFSRDWESYRQGFGDLDGEFWLGNDNLHRLTAQGDYELRVGLADFEGNSAYAVYDIFNVSDGSDNYTLTVGGYSGTAGDSLAVHNNMLFTTRDRDNDKTSSFNCAERWYGGWWYNNCHDANLNGEYSNDDFSEGVNWLNWKGYYYSLKGSVMKMKRKE